MTKRDFVFGVSGFRGKTGESFCPANLIRFGEAFAQMVKRRGGKTVSIARDTRPSGAAAAQLLASALMFHGLDALDFGVAPTPTALFAAGRYRTDGALTVTASHNTAEWNGVEFAMESGRLLNEAERKRLWLWFQNPPRTRSETERIGSYESRRGAANLHMERILSVHRVGVEAARKRRLRVVVDAGNGAGSVVSPELMRQLGCETTELFCDPGAPFPRHPEPTRESLGELMRAVKESGADMGVAHDPDADRTVLVDERGECLPEEYTFALTADALLSRRSGAVVTTVVTGGLLDETARKHNAEIVRTAIGVGHVAEKMREIGAAVGGESTGGAILPEIGCTTDGLASAAAVVCGLAQRGGSLSEWAGEFGRYVMAREKIPLRGNAPPAAALEEAMAWAADAETDRTDGLKWSWPDGSWVCARPSGTEPVLRVFAESRDPKRAGELLERSVKAIAALLS